MNLYVGKVSTFNGRYWKDTELRIHASSLQAATGQAARKAPKKKREHLEAIKVYLEYSGPVPPPTGGDPIDLKAKSVHKKEKQDAKGTDSVQAITPKVQ